MYPPPNNNGSYPAGYPGYENNNSTKKDETDVPPLPPQPPPPPPSSKSYAEALKSQENGSKKMKLSGKPLSSRGK